MTWTADRMTPKAAKAGGHIKCEMCEANYKFAIKNHKDVIVDRLSGDIVGVCIA